MTWDRSPLSIGGTKPQQVGLGKHPGDASGVDLEMLAPPSEMKSQDTLMTTNSSLPSKLGPKPMLRFSQQMAIAPTETISNILRMHNLEDKYTAIGRDLGKGHFGSVHEVADKKTGKHYALKTVNFTHHSRTGLMDSEVETLGALDHPYIIKLHGFFQEAQCYHLIMDLCTGGDLRSFVQIVVSQVRQFQPEYNSGLNPMMASRFAYQMLAGLMYLHHFGFVHRDVKPDNYLLENGTQTSPVKLADFGLASKIKKNERLSQRAGTLHYMAPEVRLGKYNEKCDIWSLGVTLFAICTDLLPFSGQGDEDYLVNVDLAHINMNDAGWKPHPPEHRKLALEMLTNDPEKRPSAKQILSERPWLTRHAQAQGGCCVIA